MERMSNDECRAFLGASARTAKLATVRSDGRPHVAPVWFIVDSDSIVFMTFENARCRCLTRRICS
jgi:nitroimidazol reductase NimA-like FMN-containing flavoprotein (pyridoxamine 5'-phosphate oxidase superfamily)